METTMEGFEFLESALEIIERTTWDGMVRVSIRFLRWTSAGVEAKVGWSTTMPKDTRAARSFADNIMEAAEIADFITGLGIEIATAFDARETKVTRENYEEALEEIKAALYNKDADAIRKWLEV